MTPTERLLGYDFKGRPIYPGDKVRVLDSDCGKGAIGKEASALSLTQGSSPKRVYVSLRKRRGKDSFSWLCFYPDWLEVVKRKSP